MARIAPALLATALLVAACLAFVYTESLKLATSPVTAVRVTRIFSPTCSCATSKARIAFRLAKRDVVTIAIVDREGRVVRTVTRDRAVADDGRLAVLWNGRDDHGAVVADGIYRPRVRLGIAERTYDFQNLIRVDTEPPKVTVLDVAPRVFSPDGDRRAPGVTVRYRVDTPARASLLVDGVQRVLGFSRQREGSLTWFGKIDGVAQPAGTYRLAVAAEDLAGNRSAPIDAGPVQIRYVELDRRVYRVQSGASFVVRVDTDAATVRWRLGARTGSARPPVLRLRASDRVGLFRLVVEANGHEARARVVTTP